MASEGSKTVEQEFPPPPPPTEPPQIVAVKPSNEELVYVVLLLLNLTTTSHALQTLVKPLFGKTFGPMSFHAGTLLSFLLFSFTLPDSVKQHRRALEAMSVLQVAAAVVARSLGAVAAPLLEEPTLAASVVHTLLSFPTIGLGGAVWLHWTRKFVDPEPTRMGRLTVRVFTCVALITIVKYAEPLIGDTILRHVNFPPNATLICLAMTTYTLSVIFKPDRSVSEVHLLSKFITVLSLFMVMLAVSVPPRTPAALAIQYQRFTPSGFVQVVDNRFTAPVTRYLRLDASVLGAVELGADGDVGDTKGISSSLLEAVTLAQGTAGKRALVIGVQAGASAKSLISNSYDTTVVDARGAVVTAVRDFFGLPDPNRVIIDDPAVWIERYGKQNAGIDETKFDVVVHDVFEGGELPAKLFTMEFWTALRSVMDSTGVIAVNYVAKPNAVTFKSTLNMLRKTFKTCRAFHSNSVNHSPLSAPEEFTEVVIFCTPAESLEFGKISSDSEFSPSTLAVLSNLDERELDITAALGQTSPERYLLKEEDPVMARWGKDSINDYWKLMRQRFPAPVWHSY